MSMNYSNHDHDHTELIGTDDKNGDQIKENLITAKINIIISEHNFEDDGERIVFNEIIKLKQEEDATPKQILTSLGSIRGIKNKVKDRIERYLTATTTTKDDNKFAQKDPWSAASKNKRKTETYLSVKDGSDYLNDDVLSLNYQSLESNKKIIIYTTSLGIIRKTKADCLYLTTVFRSMMLKTEERDIVSQYYNDEFKRLFPGASLPQVVINSFPVGGRKEIENLIETGEIKLLTKGFEKVLYSSAKCQSCNGYGYMPCPVCLGSCKSRTVRIGKSRHVNNLKCTKCKEGMIRCERCINLISY